MAAPLRDRRWQLAAALLAVAVAWAAVRALLGPPVLAYAVARQDLVMRVVASGQVMSPARITLGSLLLAQVAGVHCDEGDEVVQHQLLVELDDAEPKAAAGLARAAVAQASARLDQVRSATSGAGSEFRLAVAGLQGARAQLAQAEARLARTRLRAPATGLVLLRSVEPGDVVQPGKTLLVLSRRGETRLTVQPDEKSLAVVRVGQRALALADAFPAEPFPAEVSFVAPSVDPTRGTVEVRLRVPRPPPFLRPDMTVSVNVEVGRHPGVLAVPAEALRESGGEPWLLVVRQGRAERRAVRLGLRGEGMVEVTGGLVEGEEVVPPSAGAVPGQRVRPRAARPIELARAR